MRRKSTICSVQVWGATCSEPKVAVSTYAWNLECQSIGVMLGMRKIGVIDRPLMRSCMRLASTYEVVMTDLPRGVAASSGIRSFRPV